MNLQGLSYWDEQKIWRRIYAALSQKKKKKKNVRWHACFLRSRLSYPAWSKYVLAMHAFCVLLSFMKRTCSWICADNQSTVFMMMWRPATWLASSILTSFRWLLTRTTSIASRNVRHVRQPNRLTIWHVLWVKHDTAFQNLSNDCIKNQNSLSFLTTVLTIIGCTFKTLEHKNCIHNCCR